MGAALRTLEQGGTSAMLSLVSLLIFVSLFVGVVVWTMRKKHDEPFERARNLPFHEQDEANGHGGEN